MNKNKKEHNLIFFDVDDVLNNYDDLLLSNDFIKENLSNDNFDLSLISTQEITKKKIDLLKEINLNKNEKFKYFLSNPVVYHKFLLSKDGKGIKIEGKELRVENQGFVTRDKLNYLSEVAQKYNTKNYLISSWRIFKDFSNTHEDFEKFFELELQPFEVDAGATEYSRLFYTQECVLNYAKENHIQDLKEIKILYLDDFVDKDEKTIAFKKEFKEKFNVLFIHPNRQNPFNGKETKEEIKNFFE